MAAQLEAAEEQRAELEKLRNDLIAWTSHDLRTPLTSIRAMIEALNDGLVDDEETRARYYRTMRPAANMHRHGICIQVLRLFLVDRCYCKIYCYIIMTYPGPSPNGLAK